MEIYNRLWVRRAMVQQRIHIDDACILSMNQGQRGHDKEAEGKKGGIMGCLAMPAWRAAAWRAASGAPAAE